MKNLLEGLMDELQRNRELLKLYEEIPTGVFGAIMLKNDIKLGEKVIKENNIVGMLKIYKKLKDNE